MNEVMVCLVGEQPMPNLLPVRFDQPSEVVLVYTEGTKEVCIRLKNVLCADRLVYSLPVHPYDILDTMRGLRDFINGRGWKQDRIVFNITGGTKAMSLAAYTLAEEWRRPFLYVESEESESQVLRYSFSSTTGEAVLSKSEVIPGVITLDDYLRVHLDSYQQALKNNKFEDTVRETLKSQVDELRPNIGLHGQAVEIDLVLRCGNQVAIAEVKDTDDGGQLGKGIRGLISVGRRDLLGTYTKKMIILGKPWPRNVSNTKEFAQDSEIRIIELPSYGETGFLSEQDKERLIREVGEALGR